jgi:hypothetical protein
MWTINRHQQPRASALHRLDYNKANFKEIREELNSIDWQSRPLPLSANEAWNLFRDTVLQSLHKHAPIKKKGTVLNKPLRMIYKAQKAVNKKYATFGKYKSNQHPACKKANLAAKDEIRKAKLNFESKLAANIKSNKKSFYAYVNSKKRSHPTSGPLRNGNGDVISSPKDLAEMPISISHLS